MKDRNLQQFKSNNELLVKLGVVDTLPLKQKFLIHNKPKFGGKKKKSSNSGKSGIAARRLSRACVVSQSSSPEQYQNYCRAIAKEAKEDKSVQHFSGERK